MPIFPIGFSIHKSKIIDYIPEKKRLLSPLVPGDLTTYIYNNEVEYYNNYKESYFATTFSKGGWDCMRHYEILACGSIPLFIDLDQCPKNIMTFFPKEFIQNSNKIYNLLKDYDSFDKIGQSEKVVCNDYIKYLLQYTRDNLTNEKMAQYILNKINLPNVKKILFLSDCIDPDYLRCTILPGFKEILGTECHDYPKIPHIYTDYSENDARQCYGKGISYTRVIDPSTRNDTYDFTIQDDIMNHKYDLIVYGSYHRGMPFWENVNLAYKPNEIVLLCGEDYHQCNYHFFDEHGYNVFVRELYKEN